MDVYIIGIQIVMFLAIIETVVVQFVTERFSHHVACRVDLASRIGFPLVCLIQVIVMASTSNPEVQLPFDLCINETYYVSIVSAAEAGHSPSPLVARTQPLVVLSGEGPNHQRVGRSEQPLSLPVDRSWSWRPQALACQEVLPCETTDPVSALQK